MNTIVQLTNELRQAQSIEIVRILEVYILLEMNYETKKYQNYLYKKTRLKYLGALSRVRLYYPPASGGIELTQERGILGEIYIGKIMKIES